VETLIRSLSRFSEQALLIISGTSDVAADAIKIGPSLIFERLWKETGIQAALNRVLAGRKFEFDVERAVFLTVLHRLMVSGSDRFCHRWSRDYLIGGIEGIWIFTIFTGPWDFWVKKSKTKRGQPHFRPAATKTLIEEFIFSHRRDLFTNLDLVFFDTTSIYFRRPRWREYRAKGI
jgi:hypothetical protein